MQSATVKMSGLWLADQKVTFQNDLSRPEPGRGEALIQVHKAGICGTDLQLLQGYYEFTGIPGHEFVGRIVEAPDAPQREGERVVGEINAACGHCVDCRMGTRSHCQNRTVLGILTRNGAFAEYLTLPLENLHPLPDSVSDDAAVFVEPLAAALQIEEQVSIPSGANVLLIGAGRLGQLIARTLARKECRLFVSARYPAQRTLLKGLDLTLVPATEIPPRSMHLVVEATASEEGLAEALRAVRPRGTIVLKSTFKGTCNFDLSALVVNEIQVVGSRCGPFQPAIRLLADRQVDPLPLISARLPLRQGVKAFRVASAPYSMKVLLDVAG